ncbi:MAG: GTP 3',8-cyclase MoaA [Clostridia bacterium]
MKDSFNREINYARISVTDLCNLRCQYCMPPEGVIKKEHHQILTIEELETVANSLVELGINKIRLTGGEPLVRKGVLNFAQYLGSIPQLKTLAITTNGVLLGENALALKQAGVEYVNISLDTLSPEKYKQITRLGDLNSVLYGLNEAVKCNFKSIKINVVLLKGINDNEILSFIALSEKFNIEVRFIELMPFKVQKEFAESYFISAEDVIKKFHGLTYLGNTDNSTAEYYATENGGRLGFIRSMSNKFCNRCNRVRITADGLLITCLHGNQMFNLKPHIGVDLTEYISSCIMLKPAEHHLSDGVLQSRPMDEIGG